MGDWEALTGALDTAFISMGEGVDGPLRDLVQGLTGLVDGFNDMPDASKQAVLWIGLITAGVGLFGGATLIAIPKLAALKIALVTLGPQALAARAGLARFTSFLGGPWGIALFAATAAVALFNKQIEDGIPAQAEIVNSIKSTATAADSLQEAFKRGSLETFLSGDYTTDLKKLPGLLDHAIDAQNNWADALSTTVGQKGAYDSLKRYGDALAEMAGDDLPAAQKAFRGIRDEFDLTADQTRQLLNEMPAFRDAILKEADAKNISKDSTEFLALALGTLPGSTAEATSATNELEAASQAAAGELDDMKRALDEVAGKAIDMAAAHDDALGAINALVQAAEAEGATLTGTNDTSIRFRIRSVRLSRHTVIPHRPFLTTVAHLPKRRPKGTGAVNRSST